MSVKVTSREAIASKNVLKNLIRPKFSGLKFAAPNFFLDLTFLLIKGILDLKNLVGAIFFGH